MNSNIDIIIMDVDSEMQPPENLPIELNPFDAVSVLIEEDISCCVCFKETTQTDFLTLVDILPENITPETIIKSACGVHYICLKCLHTIVTDYTNHPINEHNSHVYCPYPFQDCLTPAGTKNIFDHQSILKILDDFEQQQYIAHTDRFAFPGYTIIMCPCTYYTTNSTHEVCNHPLLIENELITSANPGDLVVQCHQNEKCCKLFCFHCRMEVARYERECRTCRLTSENANPNIFNRYIVKENPFENIVYNDEEYESTKYFDENEYLYYNREITLEMALEHIIKLIEHETFCICPICKIHLYKTEKCNGLRHHNIERCYACGRIGTKTGGIHNSHWNQEGINGCFRFDYDKFVHTYIPEYKCTQNCQSHDQGDCQREEHQIGIQKLNKIRKKATIYHCIKSLLPNIRYNVLEILYDKYLNIPTAYELLPYKQTFLFLEEYKEVNLDYCEESLYDHINSYHPQTISEFIDKKSLIETDDYMNKYALPPPPPPPPIIEIPVYPPPPPPVPPPRRPPPPPIPPRNENEIRQNIMELENIFNRILHDEAQPLLSDIETGILNIERDITDFLDSYLPETNTDADTINSDNITDEVTDNVNDSVTDNVTDNITLYYNTSDIYIIGSDSDTDNSDNTDTEPDTN
jgi:hypothetical protein